MTQIDHSSNNYFAHSKIDQDELMNDESQEEFKNPSINPQRQLRPTTAAFVTEKIVSEPL